MRTWLANVDADPDRGIITEPLLFGMRPKTPPAAAPRPSRLDGVDHQYLQYYRSVNISPGYLFVVRRSIGDICFLFQRENDRAHR